MSVTQRKDEHLDVVASGDVEASEGATWLGDVFIVHRALPELDLDEVDLSVELFNKKLRAPLIIDSMTGGSERGAEVNGVLAEVAAELGLGMGVGSQRAALEDVQLRKTFSVVRDVAPDIMVYANLGAPQLAKVGVAGAKACVDMVKADALAIHLNPLQEAVQVEGEPTYKGVLEKVAEVVEGVGVPVLVKEVGAGLSREVVALLESVGVAGFNVAGLGGTSWARVEAIRAASAGRKDKAVLGDAFREWGIPTAAAVLEARSVTRKPIIASGGIRSGIDAAKAMVLGADAVAMALPVLRGYMQGGKAAVKEFLSTAVEELRLAMFLTGSRNAAELRRARYTLVGDLADWARSLGLGTGVA